MDIAPSDRFTTALCIPLADKTKLRVLIATSSIHYIVYLSYWCTQNQALLQRKPGFLVLCLQKYIRL